VSILAADIPKRKISLSLRALADNPWDAVEAKYSVGAKCDGTVKRLTDFGAFVELEEGIEGLVHVSEMSDKHVRAASDVCKEGDTVKVRVKAIDTRERRISLSMKVQVDSGHASDDDIAAFSSGAQRRIGLRERVGETQPIPYPKSARFR
jgi:ribosomal protein S1